VAGDHIEIRYDPCDCGCACPSISNRVKRVQDREGDHGFTPAGPAMGAALEALGVRADWSASEEERP